jgi:hypothetical protein
MSAGSGASNLGYSNTSPFIGGKFVNATSSNNPANFSSNEVSGLPGLSGAKINIDAANSKVPGICLFKGGAKKLKRKIKNITKMYKMKNKKKSVKRLKRIARKISKLNGHSLYNGRNTSLSRSMAVSRSMARSRSMAGGSRKNKTRRQYGGYSQYQNNMPLTPSYSTGGFLKPSDSALANPVPFKVLPNSVNGIDNYNHYTNQGFPSKGH